MAQRNLFKTKLCSLFARGSCPRSNCTFAHGDEELRRGQTFGGGKVLKERTLL